MPALRLTALMALVVVVIVVFLWPAVHRHRGPWTRENPLVAPVAVTRVQYGTLTLSDGRTFRLAGVRRAPTVSASDFDRALNVIVKQGVVVVRDIGDGTAMVLAEPLFYNPCGTSRWPGGYFPCPVSELMIQARYAEPDLSQPSLTARDRWRLEGATHLRETRDDPTPTLIHSSALRLSGQTFTFRDYDRYVEVVWKPPPDSPLPPPP